MKIHSSHPTALRAGSSSASGFGNGSGEGMAAGKPEEPAKVLRILTAQFLRQQLNKRSHNQLEVEHVGC